MERNTPWRWEHETPFFMTNKDWYYYNEKSCMYELTEKAPKKAIRSYEEYYYGGEIYDDDEYDDWETYRYKIIMGLVDYEDEES